MGKKSSNSAPIKAFLDTLRKISIRLLGSEHTCIASSNSKQKETGGPKAAGG